VSALARVLDEMRDAASRGRAGGLLFEAAHQRLNVLLKSALVIRDRADRLEAATGSLEAAVARSNHAARAQLLRAEGAALTVDQQVSTASELRGSAESLARLGDHLATLLAGKSSSASGDNNSARHH
jgi:hypothetical protein